MDDRYAVTWRWLDEDDEHATGMLASQALYADKAAAVQHAKRLAQRAQLGGSAVAYSVVKVSPLADED